MKPTNLIMSLLMLLVAASAMGQQQLSRGMNTMGGAGGHAAARKAQEAGHKTSIKPDVRAWKMVDNYTLADTIAVDTLTNGHQINNPIWRHNPANVTLGNLGSPSVSAFFPTMKSVEGNIFYNTVAEFLYKPDDFVYYNTKSPYTNLAYQMGYPKRRSEEFVQVLFTQNINRRANVGIKYTLSSSIGRYESQRADHVTLRLWGSYDGDYYRFQVNGTYNKVDVQENGGILNDNYILYPDSFSYDKPEDIPVQFMDAENYIGSYQFLFSHSLDLGHVEKMDTDSNTVEIPVSTVFHTLHIDKSHREFSIGNLSTYNDIIAELFPRTINDESRTDDQTKYLNVSNLVQIKLNEEFNSLLQFGLRLYIGNNVRRYEWPAMSTRGTDEDGNETLVYNFNKGTQVTSFVGGQIFKNLGRNLRWNAGAKLYFQGYNTGDFIADGKIETQFRLLDRTTTVSANGSIELRSPELYENSYFSNHYLWTNDLDRTKTFNVNGGIKIAENKLELRGFASTINKHIYFDYTTNDDGAKDFRPSQKDGVTQIFGLYLYKHFSGAGFNSINRAALQHSSDNDVLPLPLFAVYSSNFFEHLFFSVLTLQIGFDLRYNTKYFAPQYVPALMQYAAQREREVGNHPYFDPFINIQLKRARIYLKYEHVNAIWGETDYFNTIHYPANPQTFKFGVSWNFYD